MLDIRRWKKENRLKKDEKELRGKYD